MRGIRSAVLPAIAILLCVTPGCQPAAQQEGDQEIDQAAASRTANADRNAVIAQHLILVDAYERGDVDAFVGVLDPTAELLMFHPRLTSRYDGVDEVREHMGKMFARLGGAKWSDMHADVAIEGNVAWLTSQIVIESPQLDPPFAGRSTEIFLRKPEGWKLVHGHWSSAPGAS